MLVRPKQSQCQFSTRVRLGNEELSFVEEIRYLADLLNTSWDMLLTDVKTDEMYKIIINICLEICKKHVLPK